MLEDEDCGRGVGNMTLRACSVLLAAVQSSIAGNSQQGSLKQQQCKQLSKQLLGSCWRRQGFMCHECTAITVAPVLVTSRLAGGMEHVEAPHHPKVSHLEMALSGGAAGAGNAAAAPLRSCRLWDRHCLAIVVTDEVDERVGYVWNVVGSCAELLFVC